VVYRITELGGKCSSCGEPVSLQMSKRNPVVRLLLAVALGAAIASAFFRFF
jgi:hypothetical protein